MQFWWKKIEPGLPLYSFWETSLKININRLMWTQIYKNCFKTIQDNELKWFQYRILHRILGTNDYLFRIRYKNNNLCSFCNKDRETIVHLFVDCCTVKNFWEEIKSTCYLHLGIELSLSASDIILGALDYRATTSNIIYLTAKFYRFRITRSNGSLNFHDYCQFIKKVYCEQEYAAKLQFMHEKFLKIWRGVKALLIWAFLLS